MHVRFDVRDDAVRSTVGPFAEAQLDELETDSDRDRAPPCARDGRRTDSRSSGATAMRGSCSRSTRTRLRRRRADAAYQRQDPSPALPRGRRPRGAGAADRAVHVARALARAALLLSRRAVRGSRPDRRDRADQGDRPVRPRARRRAHDVRDAEHHRRDQAALPRQGLVGARAARPPGAERAAVAADGSADGPAQPLADDSRSSRRRPGRPRKRCSKRSSPAVRTRRSRSPRAAAATARTISIRSSRSGRRSTSTRSRRTAPCSRPDFRALDERERKILQLRFFDGLTQSQIARTVGISQMHVSRLIRRSLEKIRAEIASDEEPSARAS